MTDTKQASFDILVELTQNDVDEASAELGKLIGERRNAAQQLDVLREYRQDYANRLNQAGQTGITASNYHNFTRFLATLDEAIVQQTRVMTHMDHNISVSKENWRSKQQRLHSYETLQTRRQQQRAAIESRREQRLTDELSAALHRRASLDRGLQ